MRFWVRELAGWLLVGLGLVVFYFCFALLMNAFILEAGPLTVIGIVIFRGGIHLLKMAVAARICLQANTLLREREARPVSAGGALAGGSRLDRKDGPR